MNERELKIFEENKQLVPYCIRFFKTSPSERECIIQEGYIGLIQAIKHYDESKGKFSTYACNYIRGYMSNYFAFQGEGFAVKMSGHDSRKYYKIKKFKNTYFSKNGEFPTDELISKELKISLKTVKLLNKLHDVTFLDKPLGNDKKGEDFRDSAYDLIGQDKDEYEDLINKQSLKQALDKLPHELKYIVNEYYFKERTQVDIAKELHHDQIYISRKLKVAIKILRSEMEIIA